MEKVEGGCHCGAVRFAAEADLSNVMECNCSHCSKKGFILAFAPAEKFTLLSGEDALTEYLFNKKAIRHLFCSRCGVQPFGRGKGPDGADTVAINVRCVDHADLAALTPKQIDGKNY
jgi:hypothetical protein